MTYQDEPFSGPWSYAAAANGIVSSATAVTIAPAATGLRNYLTDLVLAWDSLGAAVEVTINDGAAGTVLWRFKIQATSAGNHSIRFRTPLRGTAGNLLEVKLSASTTGGVYVNASGFQRQS